MAKHHAIQEESTVGQPSFIAWVAFQRRILSMQSYFGYEPTHIAITLKNRFLKPLEYLAKAQQTLKVLLTQQPQTIWIQLPPSPLLYLTYLYKVWNKVIYNRSIQIIADCHNATFRAPWVRSPFVVECLNRCSLVLVHNEHVQQQAIQLGVAAERVMVLRDRMPSLECSTLTLHHQFQHPWILTPCSFNADEPIAEILAAAAKTPDLTFVITGNTNRAQGKHDLSQAPANVRFTGFIPKADFDALLCHTDAVLGLTKLDGIQLSVAGEAVSAGKPMVLSDTTLLKTLFHQGAVYVDTFDPGAIARGCQQAIENQGRLSQEVSELRDTSDAEWVLQARQVGQYLVSAQDTGNPGQQELADSGKAT